MRKMECEGCGSVVHFEVTIIGPENGLPQDEEGFYYYCPVCSSAEPSVEVSSIEGGA
jgi:Zn finger protein HypA/HybF involved in hydrogenase expression